jgi:xanthine dioxygenase
MTIKLEPFPLPPTANVEKLSEFGRVVSGVNPARLSKDEFVELEKLLYKVCITLELHDSRELIHAA